MYTHTNAYQLQTNAQYEWKLHSMRVNNSVCLKDVLELLRLQLHMKVPKHEAVMNMSAHPSKSQFPSFQRIFCLSKNSTAAWNSRTCNIVPCLRDPPTFLTASQDVAGCCQRLRIRLHSLLLRLHLIMKSARGTKMMWRTIRKPNKMLSCKRKSNLCKYVCDMCIIYIHI